MQNLWFISYSSWPGLENTRNIKADTVDGTRGSVQPGNFSPAMAESGRLHTNTRTEQANGHCISWFVYLGCTAHNYPHSRLLFQDQEWFVWNASPLFLYSRSLMRGNLVAEQNCHAFPKQKTQLIQTHFNFFPKAEWGKLEEYVLTVSKIKYHLYPLQDTILVLRQ